MEYKERLLEQLDDKYILDYDVSLYNLDTQELVNNNLKDSFENLKSIIIEKVENKEYVNVFEEVTEEVWDNTRHLWIDTQFDYMNVFSEEIENYLKVDKDIVSCKNFEFNFLGIIGVEQYIANTILENERDFYKELQLEIVKNSIRNDEIEIDSEEKMERILDFVEENIEEHYFDDKLNIQDYEDLSNGLMKFKDDFLEEISQELEFDEEMEF